jgi:hypothetical protein
VHLAGEYITAIWSQVKKIADSGCSSIVPSPLVLDTWMAELGLKVGAGYSSSKAFPPVSINPFTFVSYT